MSTSYGPPVKDLVNHPPHYKANGMEAIDVIEAFAAGNYHRGNALKYLLRAGKKGDTAEDLMKAKWYIQREIDKLDGQMMSVPVSPPMARQEVFEHAMPDIDQGADDSHMVFAEEVPVREHVKSQAILDAEAIARMDALKYLLRAGKKGDTAEDLMKAKWYIQREID